MMKRLVYLGLIVAATGLAQRAGELVREGGYWVQTTTASLDASALQGLQVTTWGDVALRGEESRRISFTLRKRVRANSESEAARILSSVRAHTVQHGSTVHVRITPLRSDQVLPELTVSAPRRLSKTYLETHGGNIEARILEGKLIAESGGGKIHADGIQGGLMATTAGGEISLGRVEGLVKCISGAGNIRVARAGGEAWFETAGGEILIDEAGGEVHASTGGGNIRVGQAAAAVIARTAGGVIEVGQAKGPVIAENASGAILVRNAHGVKCESAGGAIRLKSVSGSLRAMTAAGDITAVLGGSVLENSFLTTSLGDITVFIPSNLRVTIRAHNEPAGRGGKIVSDFPEVRARGGRQSVYEPLLAEGAINGGGPLLRISAVGGTIYLRRR